jgi:hypothetical protein
VFIGVCQTKSLIHLILNSYKFLNNMQPLNFILRVSQNLGKNWKQTFDNELHMADSINWIRIKHKMNPLSRDIVQTQFYLQKDLKTHSLVFGFLLKL